MVSTINWDSKIIPTIVLTAVDKLQPRLTVKHRCRRHPQELRTPWKTKYEGTTSEPIVNIARFPRVLLAAATKQNVPKHFIQKSSHKRSPCTNILDSAELKFPFDTKASQVTFVEMLTNKRSSYIGGQPHTLAPAECPLDTGADLKLFSANIIRREGNSCNKCTDIPGLRTASKDRICQNEIIFLYLKAMSFKVPFGSGCSPTFQLTYGWKVLL